MSDQALLSFKTFNIIFENEYAVYAPGDEIKGKILLHPIHDIQISPIKLSFKGYGTLCNSSDESLLETVKYWDETLNLSINVTNFAGDQDHLVAFQKTLPLNLETSIESRSLTITYSVKARFTYRTPDNHVCPLTTIRGFTVISPVRLDYLDIKYFKANTYSVSKKYGFLCTAGHVNLKINVERTAYLSAENIVLAGHVENDTNRRVDNVVGVMQKVIEVIDFSNSKMMNSCERPAMNVISTEVTTLRKENLAMYIDPHETIKITRNFAIPTCRPSSCDYIHINHYLISVSYRLLIKVKQINEVCDTSIPIFIGSVPHQTCHNDNRNCWVKLKKRQNDDDKRAHYQHDLSERPCSLLEINETYLSKYSRMLHVNVYPYFPYLQTSTKQGYQFRKLAGAIQAENAFMMKVNSNEAKKTQQKKAGSSKMSSSQKQLPLEFVQPLKPENLLLMNPNEKSRVLPNKSSSLTDWLKSSNVKVLVTKDRPVPAVGISIADSAVSPISVANWKVFR